MPIKQVPMLPTFAYCLSTIGLIPWIAALMWWPGGAWPGGVEPHDAATASPRPHLPAAFAGYRALDNTLLIGLPDSGGYTVNGMPVDSTRLGRLFHQVFDSWEPSRRGAFLLDNPKRPWRDVELVVEEGWEAGVLVFDAVRSNHMPLREIMTVCPDESFAMCGRTRSTQPCVCTPHATSPR